MQLSSWKYKLACGLILLALMMIFPYLILRTILLLIVPIPWYDKLIACFLLIAEIFSMIQAFGYFINLFYIFVSDKIKNVRSNSTSDLKSYPAVAILVASYKEPLQVIEDTLTCFYNLTYPNKHLYLLDDTRYDIPWNSNEDPVAYRKSIEALSELLDINLFRRKWRGAKAGMINDFLSFLEGKPKEGFEFIPHSKNDRDEKAKYLIVFDADMNPFPNFVEQMVSKMEASPKLAFVQTPQFYSNFETNRLAKAASLQQSIFYEYICEGKSLKNTMFCCGTNFIMRREALIDVKGFDELSVTEDVATSLKLHIKGWSTAYLNRVTAFGMAPEDLGGYFKQQFRWALGTFGLLKKVLKEFIKSPAQLSAITWWEYFITTSHYLVGWVYFIMTMCPILYLFFGFPSYFARPEIYLLFFTPYFILSIGLFLWSLHDKKYRYRELISGTVLTMICFPIYMRATLLAFIGIKGKFSITPKKGSASLSLIALWPQLSLAIVSFTAGVWGILTLFFVQEPLFAFLVNIFWAFFHFIILSSILYYNNPQAIRINNNPLGN
jgi:cellulose synthase (UDP-forming)